MVRSLRELSAEIVAELVKLAAENCWKEHREYRESNEQRLLNKKSAVAAISNNFSSHYVSDTGPLRIARELIDACNTRIPQDVRNFLKCHFFTLKFSGGYSLVQCRYGGVTKRSQVGNKSVMEGTLDTLKLEHTVAALNATRTADTRIELNRHGILRFPELPEHILATGEWYFVEVRDRTNHIAVRFYQDIPGLGHLFGYRFMTIFARGLHSSAQLLQRANALLGENVTGLLALPESSPCDELVENGKYAADVSLQKVVFPLIMSTGRSGIWSDGDLKGVTVRNLIAAIPSTDLDVAIDFLNAVSPCDGLKFSKCIKCRTDVPLESDSFWDRAQETLVFAYNSWKSSWCVTDRYDPSGMVDGFDWRI